MLDLSKTYRIWNIYILVCSGRIWRDSVLFLSYKWFMSQKHLCGVKHEYALVNLRASAHSRIIDFWILNISVFRQLFFSRAQIIIEGWGNKLETYNSTEYSCFFPPNAVKRPTSLCLSASLFCQNSSNLVSVFSLVSR